MMLASGVPLQLVSKILGHASVQITADLYNYIPPEATREAAEALERVLS
jgi:integrase